MNFLITDQTSCILLVYPGFYPTSLKFIFFKLKHSGLFPHRMDARDRHNGQRDKRTNERTDGRTVVRLLDGG